MWLQELSEHISLKMGAKLSASQDTGDAKQPRKTLCDNYSLELSSLGLCFSFCFVSFLLIFYCLP